LPKGKTNNFGELLGCFYALRIANANQIKSIYGDSDLVISYWSKNWVSAEKRSTDPDLALLAEWTAKELRTFNANGGSLKHIPGRINPADLGFHRD
jgi:ribonuclease HI